MTQGNIGTWQKKFGDQISSGDVLVEIETDKAEMDLECQEDGYLAKILVESGTKDVGVGRPIAVIVESESDVAAFAEFNPEDAGSGSETSKTSTAKEATKEESKPETSKPKAPKAADSEPAPPAPSKQGDDRLKASPIAKKIANEKGIPLSEVTATGPSGRIVKADVEGYTPSAPKATKPAPPPSAPPASALYTDIPLTNMRKVIASRLTESKQSVPHYYLTVEVEMDKILKLREVLNKSAGDKFKLSVNDFVIKAVAQALKQVPEANSSWQGDFIRQYHTSDISVAVATSSGLITPIVQSADSKGLATISNQVKDLATRARDGKLAPQEYQGGSFTISNLGMFGINHFTAIINPPQSCIMAVGGTEKKLVPDESSEKGFRTVSVMNVTLSCDHRVVDGAVGSRFLQAWKDYIENPLTLLL